MYHLWRQKGNTKQKILVFGTGRDISSKFLAKAPESLHEIYIDELSVMNGASQIIHFNTYSAKEKKSIKMQTGYSCGFSDWFSYQITSSLSINI